MHHQQLGHCSSANISKRRPAHAAMFSPRYCAAHFAVHIHLKAGLGSVLHVYMRAHTLYAVAAAENRGKHRHRLAEQPAEHRSMVHRGTQ